MLSVPGVFPLKGVLQHYAWGGDHYLYELTRQEHRPKPAAEYWLGAHPNHPATVEGASLERIIAADQHGTLGEAVSLRFGQLPFLLKVLDVKQMLSIQVHPSIASAIEGYEREEQQGIPVNAPHRNYKDKNHKPELMVALSPFWLLHGFKPEGVLRKSLQSTPELTPLLKDFEAGGYEQLYRKVMEMPQAEVNQILQPLIDRLMPAYREGTLEKSDPGFWAARAVETFCPEGDLDRGIFSIYFFNLLELKEGEAIYQPAGLPHAYLEGQNVELMANSDNVLRAGLTPKHIDVPELMKHVKFEPTYPNILQTQSDHQVYTTAAEEFELQRFQGPIQKTLHTGSAEIWLQIHGQSSIEAHGYVLKLNAGDAAFVTQGLEISVTVEGQGELFRSLVPQPKS